MDIRQLHYFLVLCDEMNYSRAAQRLFLSRQALRQSISALEAEMCGPLFISAHHKLALTDRGMSLQRHAAPVVEQFQQMQAACGLRSSLPSRCASASACRWCRTTYRIGDPAGQVPPAVSPCGDALPHDGQRCGGGRCGAGGAGRGSGHRSGLCCAGTGPHHPAGRPCLPAGASGARVLDKESIPLAELRGQRVLLPSLRQDLFSPLWSACARLGFAPNAEIGPSFYQAYYLVQEQLCTCLTRYEPGARRELDRVRDVLLEDLPRCASHWCSGGIIPLPTSTCCAAT